MKKLKKWILDYKLDCKLREGILEFPSFRMLYVPPTDDKIVGLIDYMSAEDKPKQEFGLIVPEHIKQEAKDLDVTHYVFQFGSKFYYTPVNEIIDFELTLFAYIGKADIHLKSSWPFLGVHGRYELMNGTRDYSDWCKKATFLNIGTLGICEKHTLAGTLPFQKACERAGIKSIIGGSYVVESRDGQRYEVKLYAKNAKGWRNLLNINKIVIIDNDGDSIEEMKFRNYTEGLICVMKPGDYRMGTVMDFLNRYFEKVYYQIDTVEYEVDDRDRDYLETLKKYFNTFQHLAPPILINDAYYLEAEDHPIKEILNNAGSVKGEEVALNQYFKNVDDNFYIFEELFAEDDDRVLDIFKAAMRNAEDVADVCDFQIDTKSMHLPEYKMSATESEKWSSLEQMFDELIEESALKIIKQGKYTEEDIWGRVKEEVRVIKMGGYVSYFLILWDICNWCRSKKILTGIGRGSAGGSLVAYLLGIIKVNPLDYDLLFERFLNEGRMKGSFPDIDTDFEGSRRDEVKRYMEEKYGKTKVASIGTYTTLQTKNSLKELARAALAAPAQKMNYLTSILDDTGSWTALFKDALRKPAMKDFVRENPGVLEDMPLCLNSPKSQSVHPCATVIIPDALDENGNALTIFDVLPMRKTDDGMLVTEWEGGEIEAAGFLKEDILGIKQLDKIRMIFDLVEETTGEVLDLENIPLDDPKTLELFKQGFNEDVFHFGSEGLSGYSFQVKPDSIIDLINMNALFRPGPMGSGAHNSYVKLKNGESTPEYDFGTEKITKQTFGLMIFQEQIMLICQEVGNFSLVEADDVRKAMGKKKIDLLNSYEEQFVEGAIENGGTEEQARELWEKMVSFAAYGFNKSHAAAYSLTGYTCNYLKCHYPMQFWITALHFAKDDKIPAFIGEIHKTGSIEIVPPAINDSELEFKPDYKEEKIYWAINKIKYVGAAAVSNIMAEREENGRFFSLDEFLERMSARIEKYNISPNPINKRVVESLIIAGAFDEVENLKNPRERWPLMQEYWEIRKIKDKDLPEWSASQATDQDWFWVLMQRDLSGLGEMNFKMALEQTEMSFLSHKYLDTQELFSEDSVGKMAVIGGIIHNVKPAISARNAPALITLVNNDEQINIKVWAKHWTGEQNVKGLEKLRDEVTAGKGRILYFYGKVSAPWGPEQYNTIQSTGAYKNETASVYVIL